VAPAEIDGEIGLNEADYERAKLAAAADEQALRG
jgi:hypothetical protein